MRPLRALALGIAAYVAFLVATLPATVVAPRVAAATQGRVSLEDVAGTVWNGTARIEVRTPAFALHIDEVRWSFQPLRLASGRVAFRVEATRGPFLGSARLARSPLAWHVDELSATGSASAIAAAIPMAAALQPGGTLAVSAPQLAWDGRGASGTASAEWRDATLSLSDVHPLGGWRAQLVAEGAAAKVALSTLKGPLRLSGEGTLALPGRFAFSGEARAEPGRERELEPVLGLLGTRRPDGAWALQVR